LNTCSALSDQRSSRKSFWNKPKGKQIDGPKENYPNFSDLLVSELHNWEFEKVEDELMTVADGDSVE
jgi:hypothetical protein